MKMCLWKFYWDCGRQGTIDGLFLATEDAVNNAIGKRVNFGEVLGKHSEVYGVLSEEDLQKIEIGESFSNKLEEMLGLCWSGYNPLDYLVDEESEDF